MGGPGWFKSGLVGPCEVQPGVPADPFSRSPLEIRLVGSTASFALGLVSVGETGGEIGRSDVRDVLRGILKATDETEILASCLVTESVLPAHVVVTTESVTQVALRLGERRDTTDRRVNARNVVGQLNQVLRENETTLEKVSQRFESHGKLGAFLKFFRDTYR